MMSDVSDMTPGVDVVRNASYHQWNNYQVTRVSECMLEQSGLIGRNAEILRGLNVIDHRIHRLLAVALVTVVSGITHAQSVISAPSEILVRMPSAALRPATDNMFTRLGLTDGTALVPSGTINGMRTARSSEAATLRTAIGEWKKYQITSGLTPSQIADSLNTLAGVTAQPNFLRSFLAVPDDPEWDEQWGAEMIGVADVWEYVRDNARKIPVLAIIDSGFDYTHPGP